MGTARQSGNWRAVAKSAEVKHFSHWTPLRANQKNWQGVAKLPRKSGNFGLLASEWRAGTLQRILTISGGFFRKRGIDTDRQFDQGLEGRHSYKAIKGWDLASGQEALRFR